MSVELSYRHIEKTEGEPARLQRVPSIRVAQLVMDYLGHGWSAEEMCRQHPYLMPAEAHAALAYYYDHEEEIQKEIHAETEQARGELTRAGHSPFLRRIREQKEPSPRSSPGLR